MAYSDIDSGKVLNKEGLLELCSQIKTEIANAGSGSGGSSYTFTDGLTESNGTVSWNLNTYIRQVKGSSGSSSTMYL